MVNKKVCYYCEGWFYISRYGDNIRLKKTFDHIIPKSKGGGHDSENLVPCCHICNGLKSSNTPFEFLLKLRSIKNFGAFYTKERVAVMIRNVESLCEKLDASATPPPPRP